MNKQGDKTNPRGGIEWTHILGPLTGRTSNPVRGCKHRCEWDMPDGKVARCYAKDVAERLCAKAYPKGFEDVTWHPEELKEIRALNEPAGIFIDSMSDLFGLSVQKEWIVEVIKTIRACPQHVFFSLTKNPSRFREFYADDPWPKNWLVGISAPPTRMFGKKLSLAQQVVWLDKALENLRESPATKRWISIEPLSFDVSPILRDTKCMLDFAVIGAATNGAATFQPDRNNFAWALKWLGCPVFFKGNLDRALAIQVAGNWREEFPVIETAKSLATPDLL